MRRFVAYILASLTIFLGIGVSFKPIATRINADLSYRNGSTIHFRLEKREGGKSFEEVENPAKYYADIMESRLNAYGVSDYKINLDGDKNISVTLTADNKKEYENIGKLLSINPEIEICNLPGKASNEGEEATQVPVADTDKVSWHSKEARLEFEGTTTIVVMPIPDDFKTKIKDMIEQAKKYENTGKKESSNDEPKKTPNSIVLWMNRQEGDEYSTSPDAILKKKIIYDQMNSTNFYYGTDESAFQIRFTPSTSKVSDISDCYKSALYYMNLLNSTEADFDCIKTQTVECAATVENLLIYGDHVHIAMSSTFISLIVAFILISFILALFYRLGALAIVSTASLNTFLSFALFVFFRPLFNIGALVGIISVFALSIFIGVLYNNYLHEEVYKGRSLRKANFEASKKTTLITIDLSVIAFLLGIGLYFIGGKTVGSAGIILIAASLFNLFINTFVLKGLMWLITNNTSTQKQYKLLGIDEKKVPDLTKEEKQSYFGPYENKDFTKKKKLSGIIFGSLTAVACISMIVFAAVKKDVFNSSKYYSSNNVFHLVLRASADTEPTSVNEIKTTYLTKIKHNGNALKYNDTIYTYNYEYYVKEGKQVNTYYHFAYDITITDTNINSLEYTVDDSEEKMNLSRALQSAFLTFSSISVDDLSECLIVSKVYNNPSSVGLIIGATSVATIVSGLYFWIRRYRLSRVIPVVGGTLVSNIISLGVISLTRIPATSVMAIGVGIVTIYTLLAALCLMHKEKDLLSDERLKSIDTRKAALSKALKMGALPLMNFGIVISFITLSFLAISNKVFVAVFFSSTLGIIVSSLMLLTLFTPIADYLDSKLSLVKLPEIKIKKRKKVVVKSNEPEEATFIGIND